MLVSNSLKATSSTWSFVRIGFDLQLLYSETFDDVMLPVRRIVENKDKRRIFSDSWVVFPAVAAVYMRFGEGF